MKTFADAYKTKWPNAVAKITDKPDALLCLFDTRPNTGSI